MRSPDASIWWMHTKYISEWNGVVYNETSLYPDHKSDKVKSICRSGLLASMTLQLPSSILSTLRSPDAWCSNMVSCDRSTQNAFLNEVVLFIMKQVHIMTGPKNQIYLWVSYTIIDDSTVALQYFVNVEIPGCSNSAIRRKKKNCLIGVT